MIRSKTLMYKLLFMWCFPVAQASTRLLSWTGAGVVWATCVVQASGVPVDCFVCWVLSPRIGFSWACVITSSSARTGFWVFLIVYFRNLLMWLGTSDDVIFPKHTGLTWWLRPRGSEFPRTVANLCQCAVISFLSLLDHLNDVTLGDVHQICLSWWQPNVACPLLRRRAQVAEIAFVYCLRVTFSSLWALRTALGAAVHLLGSLACRCAAGNCCEVGVCAGARCVYWWVLFVWWGAVGLWYLIFQTDLAGCARQGLFLNLLFFQGVHLIQGVLNLLVLFATHILRVCLAWC